MNIINLFEGLALKKIVRIEVLSIFSKIVKVHDCNNTNTVSKEFHRSTIL